jgi:glutamate synthase (NADPH/NADH) large chain
VLDARLNGQLVVVEEVDAVAAERLRILVERHRAHTGSPRAARLLANWPAVVGEFRLVRPKDEVGRIEAEAEGTERTEAEEGVTIP